MGNDGSATETGMSRLTAEELRGSLGSLPAFLQSVSDGILVQDRGGTVIFVNDAGARLCGFASAAEMQATPIGDVLDRFGLFDENGQPFPAANLPAQRVLSGMPAAEAMLRTRVRGGHDERWSMVNATPVLDAEGTVQFAVSVFRDLTEQRRAEITSRFLADASAALAESLDYETTLQGIARLAVPRVADWCSVEIADADGIPRLLALAHVDPEKVALAHEHRRRYPADPDAPYGSTAVIRTGRSQVLHEIPDASLVAGARDADHLAILRVLGLASSMIVPLIARGRVLGTITFVSSSHEWLYGPDDLAFAEELGRRAAIAVDNARLYRDAQAAEARFRTLFEYAPDTILVADAEGRYLDVNPAATALLGYGRDELLRLSVPDVVAAAQERTGMEYAAFRENGQWRGDLHLRRKDGTLVPVEVQATAVNLPTGSVYIAVARDISERRAHEQQQQDFLAIVAHDLRTPLTALKGYASLMQRRGAYNERSMAVMVAQAERLDRLINDVLEVSRLDAHRLELRRSEVDLTHMVRQCVIEAEDIAERHPVRVELPDRPIIGWWDSDRICQVIQNLVSNAIKYSPEGGEVVVHAEDIGDRARVSVSDRGIGIPAEALPHLFDRFYRAENVQTGSVKGLGLGLYIAASLVEAHGGAMSVESTLGTGSTFVFTLPYTASPA
ncbi:MAG: PAS domain S-box protein [Chloroflexota bacterium]|nr:PAS domain S-box protein [Chloroflexota bacterium]